MQDLDDIAAYIAKESGEAEIGRGFILNFFDVAKLYANQPDAGAPRDRYGPGVRSFLVGNYVAYYQKRRHGISVVKIRHGARKAPKSI